MPIDTWDQPPRPIIDNPMIDPAWWFRPKRDRDDEDQPGESDEDDDRHEN